MTQLMATPRRPELSKSPKAQAAGWGGGIDAGAGFPGDLFKLAVAEVAVEVFVFGVGGVDGGSVDLGVDVAVRDQDVGPAVVIHVEKADAPAEVAGVDAEAGEVGVVFEGAVAEVEVEGVGYRRRSWS